MSSPTNKASRFDLLSIVACALIILTVNHPRKLTNNNPLSLRHSLFARLALCQDVQVSRDQKTRSWTKRRGCHMLDLTRTIRLPDCEPVNVTTKACRGFCHSFSLPISSDWPANESPELDEDFSGSQQLTDRGVPPSRRNNGVPVVVNSNYQQPSRATFRQVAQLISQYRSSDPKLTRSRRSATPINNRSVFDFLSFLSETAAIDTANSNSSSQKNISEEVVPLFTSTDNPSTLRAIYRHSPSQRYLLQQVSPSFESPQARFDTPVRRSSSVNGIASRSYLPSGDTNKGPAWDAQSARKAAALMNDEFKRGLVSMATCCTKAGERVRTMYTQCAGRKFAFEMEEAIGCTCSYCQTLPDEY